MTKDPSSDPRQAEGALREVPYMGVIFVVAEAVKLGFENGHPDWCNLGQGQPEVGEMEGAPPRIQTVQLDPADHAYGPLEGTPELRERVAQYYNRLYRVGKQSQYTAANVGVAAGGRLALTRAFAALREGVVGYQNPDYTAYEDMFNLHLARVRPVPVNGPRENGFAVTPEQYGAAVEEHGLNAYVMSNPCNPTGNVLRGDELEEMVRISREQNCALLSDEFYSHFIYEPPGGSGSDVEDGDYLPGEGPVSAARYVEDVERDPVLIFDGLTKSHRYPGWRLGWVVGPSEMVETMARTASSIDGGPSRIVQRAAMEALQPERADQETRALRQVFCKKRNVMMRRLRATGVEFVKPSASTFYCFGSLENLKPPFNDAMTFFRRALEHKVMTVPGDFFDIDPGKRRIGRSPCEQWMRFSFGPPMDNLLLGLDRLDAMLAEG